MIDFDYSLRFGELIDSVDITDGGIDVPDKIIKYIDEIGSQIENQKGVYTVLVTLFFYKIYNSEQDIRLHQSSMKGGFSGRSFDTKYITPMLKKMNFPSMSESGWLTRSLEQPYPYNLEYDGKISNPNVRKSFLHLIQYVQKNGNKSEECLKRLIWWGKKIKEKNKVVIKPIENPELVTIEVIMKILKKYFYNNYETHGGSKLPVICFHSLFKIILKEIKRYEGMELKELGFHTTSDRTSKSSGDIEIFDENNILFESLEIKYGIEIDIHIINRVIEKILIYNPKRYFVLSTVGVNQDDYKDINVKLNELYQEHGCYVIVNGIESTLKYYFRLISDLTLFLNQFTNDILIDKEIKSVHKKYWKSIIESLEF